MGRDQQTEWSPRERTSPKILLSREQRINFASAGAVQSRLGRAHEELLRKSALVLLHAFPGPGKEYVTDFEKGGRCDGQFREYRHASTERAGAILTLRCRAPIQASFEEASRDAMHDHARPLRAPIGTKHLDRREPDAATLETTRMSSGSLHRRVGIPLAGDVHSISDPVLAMRDWSQEAKRRRGTRRQRHTRSATRPERSKSRLLPMRARVAGTP